MNPLVLRTATRYLLPLLVLFSLLLLFEGHHKPGGGFSGGLMAAAAIALCGLAYDAATARRIMRFAPPQWIGAGLLAVGISGVWGWTRGEPFLSGVWTNVPLPGGGDFSLGTPLLFDAGVYLMVIGAVLMILLTFGED